MLGDTGAEMMARSKTHYTTKDSYYNSRQTRVANVNATRSVRPVVLPRLFTFSPILLEDRRTYHPDGPQRAPAAYYRSDTQLIAKGGKSHVKGKSRPLGSLWSLRYNAPPAYVGFRRPDRVAICIRRKTRRQVLFAAGVGGGRVRPGKRTYKSGFHCN